MGLVLPMLVVAPPTEIARYLDQLARGVEKISGIALEINLRHYRLL